MPRQVQPGFVEYESNWLHFPVCRRIITKKGYHKSPFLRASQKWETTVYIRVKEKMKLFEAVPQDFFSILASPNRVLYADALEVLYSAYQSQLKIPEDALYTMLRGNLEDELEQASFEGEDIAPEEYADTSGRARFLIRKLCGKGWLEKERGDDFREYINIPPYSSQILEVLHQLTQAQTSRGYSYVFNTYSTLKVASEGDSSYEKMLAIYSAYDNTTELVKLLQQVYHSVKHFFRIQVEMSDISQILATHFDEFGQKVMESYIRPLKIRDSVPKYRGPIVNILNAWVEDEPLLMELSRQAFQEKRQDSLEACRAELREHLFQITDIYNSIEHDYLDEIDRQVRRYTRATTQKLEALTNRDQSVRGNLHYLLSELADHSRQRDAEGYAERIQGAFQLLEQTYISEHSLWFRKRPGKRVRSAPLPVEETPISSTALQQLSQLQNSPYSRAAVERYVGECLSGKDALRSQELPLSNDRDYIMSILAVLSSGPRSFYQVRLLDGTDTQNGYTIPRFELLRKAGHHEPSGTESTD